MPMLTSKSKVLCYYLFESAGEYYNSLLVFLKHKYLNANNDPIKRSQAISAWNDEEHNEM